MKKFVLPLLLLSGMVQISAQSNVYHSFPDSNATWNISAQGCCWTSCPGPPTPNPVLGDYLFTYSIGGDTIINSTAYHMLYKSGSVHEHCYSGNFINTWTYYNDYAGGYREDTALKHVYLMQPFFTAECLLYDFSANVGDTINYCDGCAVVTSIDSILIGSSYRKRFNLSAAPLFVIEGIGSTGGLLEPLCPFEYGGTLTCFTEENQTLYPDTVTTCDVITDINPIESRSRLLTVAPNPFSGSTMIYAPVPMKKATLTVLNCVGETVAEVHNINGLTFSFDGNALPHGLYIFQLTENNVLLATGKAVIAD